MPVRCVYLLAAFKTVRLPAPDWRRHTVIASAALCIAVNSKMQYFVVGAAALLIQSAAVLTLLWCDQRRAVRTIRARSLVASLVLAPLVFFSPIRNTVLFGNPVYPFVARVAGVTLPGTQTNSWVGPARLEGVTRVGRYVLSQLDFDAINHRCAGFNQDQGDQPDGADGNRMGGALSVLLVGSAGALVVALRRRRLILPDWVAIAAALALLATVVAFPGSNELRYFCFVNIMTSLLAVMVVQAGAAAGDAYAGGLQTGLRLLLIGSMVFTNFATGLRQLGAVDVRTLPGILAREGVDTQLAAALNQSDTLCYVRPDGYALFFSPLLDPIGRGHRYRIVIRNADAECPAGAAVIR